MVPLYMCNNGLEALFPSNSTQSEQSKTDRENTQENIKNKHKRNEKKIFSTCVLHINYLAHLPMK